MAFDLEEEKEQLKKRLADYSSDLKSHKKALEEDALAYRDTLKEKYEEYADVFEKGKYVALGLGAIYVAYKMLSWIWEGNDDPEDGDDKKVVVVKPREPFLVRTLKRAIASFIVTLAKKELSELLEKLKADRDKQKRKA